jgi:dCMP deaminase
MADKWTIRFLRLAKEVSTYSKDPSTKVGAVIVRPDKSVVSVGFNGFPRKMDDDKELYKNRDEKYARIIHAEMNALIQAKQSVEGCYLFTWPFMCCDRCAVHLVQAGIEKFVSPLPSEKALKRWGKSFDRATDFFFEMGIDILQVPRGEIL